MAIFPFALSMPTPKHSEVLLNSTWFITARLRCGGSSAAHRFLLAEMKSKSHNWSWGVQRTCLATWSIQLENIADHCLDSRWSLARPGVRMTPVEITQAECIIRFARNEKLPTHRRLMVDVWLSLEMCTKRFRIPIKCAGNFDDRKHLNQRMLI